MGENESVTETQTGQKQTSSKKGRFVAHCINPVITLSLLPEVENDIAHYRCSDSDDEVDSIKVRNLLRGADGDTYVQEPDSTFEEVTRSKDSLTKIDPSQPMDKVTETQDSSLHSRGGSSTLGEEPD